VTVRGAAAQDVLDGDVRLRVVSAADVPVAPVPVRKRAFDVTVAALLLVLSAPILAIAALAILLDDGRPILYRQRRVGRGGRPFAMLKLRSMTRDAEQRRAELHALNARDGLLFKVHGDPRVTRVGRVIRRFSIDELPQLVNVVRGEMSLVGPRPLPVEPDEFDATARMRHDVPPGITGPWQIGPHAGYDEMITLDLDYVDGWSMRRDVALLARTVPALVRRRGPAC
jgi:lipopolysaccharide/colanic/teichoic acid biosynthesis glycosyltransferase